MQGLHYELTFTSWVTYYDKLDDVIMDEIEFEELWNMHPPENNKIMMFGKLVTVRRFEQTYGKSYKFAGVDHPALPFPPIIQRYIDYLNSNGFNMNMALVNWYQDENDYISFHSDDERQIVNNTPIACFSFGATRRFQLKSIATKEITNTINLNNNSLIIMGGDCQKTHKHGIPKEKHKLGRRISITLRQFY